MSHQIENKSNQFVWHRLRCRAIRFVPTFENNVCAVCREKWLRSRKRNLISRARAFSHTHINQRQISMVHDDLCVCHLLHANRVKHFISHFIRYHSHEPWTACHTLAMPTSHTHTFFPRSNFQWVLVSSLSEFTTAFDRDCEIEPIDDFQHWKLIDNLSLNVLMAASTS